MGLGGFLKEDEITDALTDQHEVCCELAETDEEGQKFSGAESLGILKRQIYSRCFQEAVLGNTPKPCCKKNQLQETPNLGVYRS